MNTNKKLREALRLILKNGLGRYLAKEINDVELLRRVENIAKEALAIPLRNCDVGTVEEQNMRFEHFCSSHNGCITCPLSKGVGCVLTWAQMPYEEVKE